MICIMHIILYSTYYSGAVYNHPHQSQEYSKIYSYDIGREKLLSCTCTAAVVLRVSIGGLPHKITMITTIFSNHIVSLIKVSCVYTLYFNDLLLRSKTYSAAKHDSNSVHKLRRRILSDSCMYWGDSISGHAIHILKLSLFLPNLDLLFSNYIKFDVWNRSYSATWSERGGRLWSNTKYYRTNNSV